MHVCTETDDFVQQVDKEVVFITKLKNRLWLVCDTLEGSQDDGEHISNSRSMGGNTSEMLSLSCCLAVRPTSCETSTRRKMWTFASASALA